MSVLIIAGARHGSDEAASGRLTTGNTAALGCDVGWMRGQI